jgi:hypothetical protein
MLDLNRRNATRLVRPPVDIVPCPHAANSRGGRTRGRIRKSVLRVLLRGAKYGPSAILPRQ